MRMVFWYFIFAKDLSSFYLFYDVVIEARS